MPHSWTNGMILKQLQLKIGFMDFSSYSIIANLTLIFSVHLSSRCISNLHFGLNIS